MNIATKNRKPALRSSRPEIVICLSVIILAFSLVASCSRAKVNFEIVASQKIVPTLLGKENNVVLKICINIEENKECILKSLNLSTQGTTNWKDIEKTCIYYTGQSDIFQDYVLFGNPQSGSAGYNFKAAQTLKPGNNYFWVAIKLKPEANILNKICFTCTEVKVNDVSVVPAAASVSLRIGHALRDKGDDGSQVYRIPGLITTKKGTIVAVYDIRWDNWEDLQQNIDIGVSRSMDKGQTWTPMKKAIDMGEWGGLPHNQNGIGDPCILEDEQTGRLWIAALWAHGKFETYAGYSSGQGMLPTETCQFILVYSDDDGVTWSDPINATQQVKQPDWHLFLQGPGMGITMKDGTLVFPAQYRDKDKKSFSTIIYSKDRGQTWQVGTGAHLGTNEAQVVEIEPGVLMLNMRHVQETSRSVSITRDLGKTWEVHQSSNSALRDPRCMASLIKVDASRNKTGKDILLFSNPNTENGRYNITIKISFDGGLSWLEENQILLDEGRGAGYSCLTMIDSETVGILYEGSVAHLCFQAVPLNEFVK